MSSADRLIRSGIKKFHKLLGARGGGGGSQKRSEGLNWDHFKHPLGKGGVRRIPPPPGSTEILTKKKGKNDEERCSNFFI